MQIHCYSTVQWFSTCLRGSRRRHYNTQYHRDSQNDRPKFPIPFHVFFLSQLCRALRPLSSLGHQYVPVLLRRCGEVSPAIPQASGARHPPLDQSLSAAHVPCTASPATCRRHSTIFLGDQSISLPRYIREARLSDTNDVPFPIGLRFALGFLFFLSNHAADPVCSGHGSAASLSKFLSPQ